MKIAINGSIIETENIYEITPISYGDYRHWFYIRMFNVKNDIMVSRWIEIRNINSEKTYIITHNNRQKFCKDYEEARKLNNKHIESVREEIIALWSNNQSKIPQINY